MCVAKVVEKLEFQAKQLPSAVRVFASAEHRVECLMHRVDRRASLALHLLSLVGGGEGGRTRGKQLLLHEAQVLADRGGLRLRVVRPARALVERRTQLLVLLHHSLQPLRRRVGRLESVQAILDGLQVCVLLLNGSKERGGTIEQLSPTSQQPVQIIRRWLLQRHEQNNQ